jgi:hypothetical protein
MRAPSMLALLLLGSVLACGSTKGLAADQPELKRPRFSIQMVWMTGKDLLSGLRPEAAKEVRRNGITDQALLPGWRVWLAAKLSSGEAAVLGIPSASTVQDLPARIEARQAGARQTLIASVTPRVIAGEVRYDVHLNYGSKTGNVFEGQSLVETVTIPQEGGALVHLGPARDEPNEQVIFLKVTRTDP